MNWIMDQIGGPKTCSCFSLHPQIPSKEEICKSIREKRLNADWIWLPDEATAQNIQDRVVAKDENVPRYAPNSGVLEMGKARAFGW